MSWEERMRTIYLAAGLFNAAERLNNLYLEKHLKLLGCNVILPQREAKRYIKDGRLNDRVGLVKSCELNARNLSNIYVGCVDGPDPDGGTCVEYGIAVISTNRAVVYRTDIRTDEEKEIGLNAMLGITGTILIYEPCYFTDLDEVDAYYHKLAKKIKAAIESI